jgi:hypothetical protein
MFSMKFIKIYKSICHMSHVYVTPTAGHLTATAFGLITSTALLAGRDLMMMLPSNSVRVSLRALGLLLYSEAINREARK